MTDGIARILAGVRSCSSDNQGAEENGEHVVVGCYESSYATYGHNFFIFIATPYRCSGDRANQLEEMD